MVNRTTITKIQNENMMKNNCTDITSDKQVKSLTKRLLQSKERERAVQYNAMRTN